MSYPLDINNDEELIKLATTSLNSKVVSQHSWLLAPMAVQAIKKIVDVNTDDNANLNMIKLVKKIGDTVEESQLIEGALIEQRSMGHGGPSRVEKAKIALIQFQISPPKTNVSFIVLEFKTLDSLKYIITYLDGKPSHYYRLRPNGPCLEGRTCLHFGLVQANQEGRMQCSSYSEVHLAVSEIFFLEIPIFLLIFKYFFV